MLKEKVIPMKSLKRKGLKVPYKLKKGPEERKGTEARNGLEEMPYALRTKGLERIP